MNKKFSDEIYANRTNDENVEEILVKWDSSMGFGSLRKLLDEITTYIAEYYTNPKGQKYKVWYVVVPDKETAEMIAGYTKTYLLSLMETGEMAEYASRYFEVSPYEKLAKAFYLAVLAFMLSEASNYLQEPTRSFVHIFSVVPLGVCCYYLFQHRKDLKSKLSSKEYNILKKIYVDMALVGNYFSNHFIVEVESRKENDYGMYT